MSDETQDQQRVRYARQTVLAGWGRRGQERLARQRALIVGLGGLGSPVATYLVAAGVGRVTLNDFDRVDLSNLHRQPLHGTSRVGMAKTESACKTLTDLNPNVAIELVDRRLDDRELRNVVAGHDVVIDCTDNFATRFAINAACVESRVPLVSAAAIRFEGQLAVFMNDDTDGPCYACLYGEDDDQLEDCRGQGVSGPLVGVIGSMAANEALRIMLGQGSGGILLCHNALDASFRRLAIRKQSECRVCGDDKS